MLLGNLLRQRQFTETPLQSSPVESGDRFKILGSTCFFLGDGEKRAFRSAMADRGSPTRSAPMDTEDVDPSDMTMDMTPKEQQQLIATLSKVNANVKLQLFYSEKRVEDLTAALGADEGEVRNFRAVERRNVEQSVKIETMQAELKERDDIIAACSKHIDELETKMRDARARGERDVAARADEAVALATSVAAETAESVLRELEHSQLDNAALMTRAASAEAALAALRDTTAALEADVAAHRSQSAANLRRSILAVASTQAAEQEIELLRSRLNAAAAAADEAAADKQVAVAREAAVREELAARERVAAGSLEEKVNELMAAETSRREEHARVLAEVRADVERARAEADAQRLSAETAKTQRRQVADELRLMRDRCDREMAECRASAERAVNDGNTRARILIEEARERAYRAEQATTSGADEAVTRARHPAARAKAEEEIQMVRRRFELDLAGAKQRAERDAEEARRAAFEARDEHIRRADARVAAADASRENAESVARSLKGELVDARSALAEAEMALAAARAKAAAEPAEMPSPTTALNRAYADSAEAQMARLMATARDAEATREEAVTELETVTAALVEERRRCDAAKAELAEIRRAQRKNPAKEEREARRYDSSNDSDARTGGGPESTARAPRLGPSPAVAPENASVKTKAMWFQKRHAADLAGSESDDGSVDAEPRATPRRRGARGAGGGGGADQRGVCRGERRRSRARRARRDGAGGRRDAEPRGRARGEAPARGLRVARGEARGDGDGDAARARSRQGADAPRESPAHVFPCIASEIAAAEPRRVAALAGRLDL